MIDCKIYVVTHRQYPIQQDKLYRTLTVGRCRIENALSEQDGECITQYNDRINELTGLYWMWKNTESQYIGLSHYRRFFYDEEKKDRLDINGIEDIFLDGTDIILTIPVELHWRIYDKSVYENISGSVGENLAKQGRDVIRGLLQERQPEYADIFDSVLNGNRMYVCNMFVTRREILDRYCDWLFSFITNAADRVNVDNLSYIQKRVIGYYGEVLPTVWLQKQDLSIKEMPIMVKWDKEWTIQRGTV